MARKGRNDQSYVALDDFEFLNSDECVFEPKEAFPATTTTSTTSGPPSHWLQCNFQNDLCGWELGGAIDENMFYWNRTTGDQLIANQLGGPVADHDGNPASMCIVVYCVTMRCNVFIFIRLLFIFECLVWPQRRSRGWICQSNELSNVSLRQLPILVSGSHYMMSFCCKMCCHECLF